MPVLRPVPVPPAGAAGPAGPAPASTGNAPVDPSLVALGYDAGWAAAAEPYTAAGLLPGRITRVDRGAYDIWPPGAGEPVRATAAGSLLAAAAADPTAAPTVGDWAALRAWPDGRRTLEVLLPRRTAFVRGSAGGETTGHVLAANLDVVFVVAALSTVPSLTRLERFLTLAWQSGAAPVVVLTKADLAADAEALADEVAAAAPGAPVLVVSGRTGVGLEAVRASLGTGRTAALLGRSGVGKSTLVNALLGEDRLATTDTRSDEKGRHTTTHRELVLLPAGGVLIDTPGLRSVQLWDAQDGLESAFADVEQLVAACRFGDCAHDTEPGCAVTAAVAAGALPARRLESYRKLQREADWLASRSDARVRAEHRKQWKVRAKEQRARGGRGL